MWSSLNGPFDIAKQDPQRSSNELRLFKSGKLGKSFQYLAVGVGQSDCGLLQAVWMPHDKGGEAIQMPNCVARVWRVPEVGTDLGYSCDVPGHKLRMGLLEIEIPALNRGQASQAEMRSLVIVRSCAYSPASHP
jgi:hypothetical protein